MAVTSTPTPSMTAGPDVPAGRPRKKRRRDRIEPYLLLLPALALLAVIFVWPTLFNIQLSFFQVNLISINEGGPWVGLDNYISLLTDGTTYKALFNTLLILTLITVVIRIVLGLGLAMLLDAPAIHRFKCAGIARSLLLIPWIVPPVVAIAAWRWLMHPRYGFINQTLLETGLIDEPLGFFTDPSLVWIAIMAVLLWNELPFVALMFIAGKQGIPNDIMEAARLDGVNRWQSFRYVTLPLLRPVIVVVALLSTIWTYNNFIYVWLTTRGGPGDQTQVLTTLLYTEGFLNFQVGRAAALGVLMSGVMVIFAVLYHRFVFSRSVGADV